MSSLYESQTFWPNIATFFVAFILSAAIAMAAWCGLPATVATSGRRAIQNFHVGQTPRLGGATVIIAVTMAALLFFPGRFWGGYIMILMCCLPALTVAFLEDVGIDVAAALRLSACFISSIVYMGVTGDTLLRVDVNVFDKLLAYPLISFAISVLFVTAAVQSMNLIDGLNGLCSGICILISVSFAAVAQMSGEEELFYVSMTSFIAILGFFVVNYPGGNIFLGDSGAYWLGFSLPLLGIYFLREVTNFAAPAMLLIFFWPAFDIFLAVWRRLSLSRRLFQADRMHPHHIVVRVLRARLNGAERRRAANSLAAAIILLLALPPMMLGVAFWNDQAAAWRVLLFCVVAYPALYIVVVRAARRDLIKKAARRARRTSTAKAAAGDAAFGRVATSHLRPQVSIRTAETFIDTSYSRKIVLFNDNYITSVGIKDSLFEKKPPTDA